jgi:hypothetical protein
MSIRDFVSEKKDKERCAIVALMEDDIPIDIISSGDILSVQPEDPFKDGNRPEGVIITLRNDPDPGVLRSIAKPLTVACGHCTLCHHIEIQ